jgi:hypothetical protein
MSDVLRKLCTKFLRRSLTAIPHRRIVAEVAQCGGEVIVPMTQLREVHNGNAKRSCDRVQCHRVGEGFHQIRFFVCDESIDQFIGFLFNKSRR